MSFSPQITRVGTVTLSAPTPTAVVKDSRWPLTGGPTLPTFDCAIQMIRPGEKTLSHRHTSSTIYHVFRGKGASVIGDQRFEWEEGDSFVAPLWHPHRHENSHDRAAILFILTDQPLMEALGFYRVRQEEEQ